MRWHWSRVHRPLFILLALSLAPMLCAEPAEKVYGGRTVNQRYGPIDQSLVFDPRQGAVGGGQTFATRAAQAPAFHHEQRVAPKQFATGEFSQQKTSWFSRLKFWAKDANTKTNREIPNATRQAEVKGAPVKEARDAGKLAVVRDLPGGDRTYLGPESKKLDRSVDPTKPLPGWTGDKMETLTLEQVRELLNKNK